jgi:hypothetical protein
MLIATRVQFTNVVGNIQWSLVASVSVVLVQHLPAYSLQGRVENICVKFSFHNAMKERCSESPDLTDGRTVSLPNPCATVGGKAVGYPVFHIHLTSVTLTIPTMSGFIG